MNRPFHSCSKANGMFRYVQLFILSSECYVLSLRKSAVARMYDGEADEPVQSVVHVETSTDPRFSGRTNESAPLQPILPGTDLPTGYLARHLWERAYGGLARIDEKGLMRGSLEAIWYAISSDLFAKPTSPYVK